ncbi:MAG: hypothetical protein ACJ8AI_08725 [Rhodopila sp.]
MQLTWGISGPLKIKDQCREPEVRTILRTSDSLAPLYTTVEFLPFGLDWTCVAEIQFSENKDLPNDNDPPRRQKVRNSTVEFIKNYMKSNIINGSEEAAARRKIWPLQRVRQKVTQHCQ